MSLFVNDEYFVDRAAHEVFDALEKQYRDIRLELKQLSQMEDDGWFLPPNGFNGIWLYEGYMYTSPEATEYFFTVGCDCRPIFIADYPKILVSGQDDCPVHGICGSAYAEEGE